MPYVELYKLQNDGRQKVVATCHFDGGVVHCEGNEVLVNNLAIDGIKDYNNPDKKLFFKDGLKFLEQLKFNFTSGYLNASEVKN